MMLVYLIARARQVTYACTEHTFLAQALPFPFYDGLD